MSRSFTKQLNLIIMDDTTISYCVGSEEIIVKFLH
jgi:hypothetical protein